MPMCTGLRYPVLAWRGLLSAYALPRRCLVLIERIAVLRSHCLAMRVRGTYAMDGTDTIVWPTLTAVDSYGEFVDANEKLLRSLPPPQEVSQPPPKKIRPSCPNIDPHVLGRSHKVYVCPLILPQPFLAPPHPEILAVL
eukprot:2062549-Rhodomonas_salina.1